VERFVERNRERVQRGSQFSQMSEEERALIIDRARRLARAGGCPADVTKRWPETGRSAETIRYTLKQFDREHPDAAVFPENLGPLRMETKRKIYQQYQRSETAETLARRYCRTRTSIYRIIAEMRAQRIMELPLDFITSTVFVACVRKSRGPVLATMRMPRRDEEGTAAHGLPPYLASLYEVPLLSRRQEAHLSQDELPEVQGQPATGQTRYPSAQAEPDGQVERLYDEAVSTRTRSSRQPAAGGVDRQAARRAGRELLRAGQRRQHVVDAGRGEFDYRAAINSAPTPVGRS